MTDFGPTCRQCLGVNVSEPPARLAVRNIDDLVGLVPFLIGFHPSDSLVVMVIESGQVQVTARADLVAVAEPGVLDDLVGRLFDRFPRAVGWFFAYSADGSCAWDVLAACSVLVGAARVGRLLQVADTVWRADHPDGPSGELNGAVTAAAAQAAVLGLPARTSRAALADSIAGPPDTEIDQLLGVFEEAAAALDRASASGRARLLRRLLREPQPDLAAQARLALLVDEPAGMLIALRALSRERASEHLELWTGVVRHSLLGYQAVPLGLLAMAAWQTGDGALQMVCLERLDRIDPGLPLAAVIDQLNHEVVPPGAWPELRRPVLRWLAEWSDELADRVREAALPGCRPDR